VERRRVGRVGQDVGQGLGPLRPRGGRSGWPSLLGTGLGLRHANGSTVAEAGRRGATRARRWQTG
jgi:hypothetical protein